MPTLASALAVIDAIRAERERRAAAKPSQDEKQRFYRSLPWRRLRYASWRRTPSATTALRAANFAERLPRLVRR